MPDEDSVVFFLQDSFDIGDPSSLPKTRDAALELQLDIIHSIAQAGAPPPAYFSSHGEGPPPPSVLALDQDTNFTEAAFLLGEGVYVLWEREIIGEERDGPRE